MSPSGNPSRRPAAWHLPAVFSTLLLVELVLDLFPTEWALDWLLIPVEAVLDVFVLLFLVVGARLGQSHGRALRSSRRALSGSMIFLLGYWMLVLGIILFQWYWNGQHLILGFFAIFIEVPFDIFLVILGAFLSFAVLRSNPNVGRNRGRAV